VKRFALVLSLVLPLSLASGEDKKFTGDPKATPGPNWGGQTVKATGAGAPDMKATSPAQARLGAERAAQLDAFRNLLAQVKGLQISAGKTMSDAMAKDEIKAKVEGIVRGFKIVGKRYYSDGGVEVDVEVPLAMLTDVIDPEPQQQQLTTKTDGEQANTGLVIDARGLKVTPALSPRVLAAPDAKVVYSVDSLSADARKSSGVASYVQSLEEAKKSMKAGDKPLVIKAAEAKGTDLVLAADDLKKLNSTNTSFLSEGRVVVVMTLN
jgi:hypothetical protein